ncbi:MAG: RNA methyltransferase [Lentisphaeraceae bacterium]|nr:RNA methyltransferase [Lentisphaeraceae bacterium]
MNFRPIENLDIPELQIYRHLRDNAVTSDNSFIADSPKVVNMLLETDIEVRSILATEKYFAENEELIKSKNIPALYVAGKKVMETIVGHRVHHGVMMHGVRPPESALSEMSDQILMLDEISKNDNVGAIARSAAALGVDSFVVPNHGPHPYGRRALRVSMGYVSKLKVNTYDDIFATIKNLQVDGYKVFAAEATEAATPLASVEVPQKWVLLMGHEGNGISQEVQDACDEVVQIEMEADIKSFNVGIAASILMYQFVQKSKV